jgi:hypothetical protein
MLVLSRRDVGEKECLFIRLDAHMESPPSLYSRMNHDLVHFFSVVIYAVTSVF